MLRERLVTPAKALRHAHIPDPEPSASEFSLSAPGGGEGRGKVGDAKALASSHLTLPALRAGPLPLPPEGRRGANLRDCRNQALAGKQGPSGRATERRRLAAISIDAADSGPSRSHGQTLGKGHADDGHFRQDRDRHRCRVRHRARHCDSARRGRRQCGHGRYSERRGRSGGAWPFRHQQARHAGQDRCDPGAIGARRARRSRAQFRQAPHRLQQCRRADARHPADRRAARRLGICDRRQHLGRHPRHPPFCAGDSRSTGKRATSSTPPRSPAFKTAAAPIRGRIR